VANRFEREMRDLFGIVPLGHPFPRRLVKHQHWPERWYPMRRDGGPTPSMHDEGEAYPFLAVEGAGVYEIPVGPVHAGLIEPGHFRFSVVGETILSMRSRLWFVHKGIERLFQGRTASAGRELAERISGDTAVGHSLAFCSAVEEALDWDVPQGARMLRAILLELERLYNHVADVGAMCNDVGFGIVHAHCQRLRETLLRLNAQVTGHRLLRGAIHPGGATMLRLPSVDMLDAVEAEFTEIVGTALDNNVVVDRFTETAVLPVEIAQAYGTLGYVARASGLSVDARRDHPSIDPPNALDVAVRQEGDVLARFGVRVDEFSVSIRMLRELILLAGELDVTAPQGAGRASGSGVGIVEGWRGTIVHRVEIGEAGALTRVKIVDPSFLNWPALAPALADTIVPDFPLANKSFNLSYAGNDL
jgi:Ni,Fe-hydrogenase III large subunit